MEYMKKNGYNPSPIDTTHVVLPPELEQITEQLAKNVHDVWAESRIKQGWTYGPMRDDEHKKHPSLVPYEELPEQEKDYDRATAMNTVKLLLKFGFSITK